MPPGLTSSGESGDNSPEWENIGGQLIPGTSLERLKKSIRNKDITDWQGVHEAYLELASKYPDARYHHAKSVLAEIIREELRPDGDTFDGKATTVELLNRTSRINDFLLNGIRESRRKDYENPFRNLTYDNPGERDAVLGRLEDNDFIREAEEKARRIEQRLEQARLSL